MSGYFDSLDTDALDDSLFADPKEKGVGKSSDTERTQVEKDGRIRSSDMLDEPPAKKVRAPASDKFSCIRGFPAVIVRIARIEFPEAKNNTDALVAYMCCFCPDLMENASLLQMLTDDQKYLIKGHPDNSYTTVSSRLLDMKKKLDKLSNDHMFLETVGLFTLYDRLGLRMSDLHPDSLTGLDLDDNGRFLEFFSQMEKAVASLKERKASRDGRPFNF